ncbi:MAG: hypothetical protein CMJ59_12910 [Planctomycetaceae bacterium]|nr:hypothetical protein [Planctomycetaceae bacterium]
MGNRQGSSQWIAIAIGGMFAIQLPAADQRRTTVGVPARIERLVLPGPRLEVRRVNRHETAIVVRIVQDYRHGTDWRYDLEYFGQQPGTFDLVSYLQPRDGATPVLLPAVEVIVGTVLPPGQIEPNALESRRMSQLGGYRRLLVFGGIGWSVGLLVIVGWLVSHRLASRREAEAVVTGPSVVDRLRPLLERARDGGLSNRQQADLERLIVGFWRQRLDLDGVSAAEAIVALRSHEEAGQLLIKLELWLHRPATGERESIDSLLKPYEELLSRSEQSVGGDS